MPTKTTTKLNTTKKTNILINSNSFFDINISCRSPFDREYINIIELNHTGSHPQPLLAVQNIAKTESQINKLDILEQTKFYRTTFFYFVLMMDHLSDDMQMLMMTQMLSLDLMNMYCNNLDKLIKTNFDFVQSEMDKCITFQTSSDCTTPNIIKETFLEMFKNKDLINIVETQFQDVDFGEPDEDQILATDEEIVNNIEMLMNSIPAPKAPKTSKATKKIKK